MAPTRSTFHQIVTPSPSGSEGQINTLYAGHTPSTPYSLSPSPPGELHTAQRVRFSNHFEQARFVSPESPTTDPDNSRNDWGHYARHMPTSITRRPHRGPIVEEPTELIDTDDSVLRDISLHRYTSPSEFSNFSTATTEPIDPSSSYIAPDSMVDIRRAQEGYRQRFPGLDNPHYAGDRTPTNASPHRSGMPTPVSGPLPRRASSVNLLGPHRSEMFPHPDGYLRDHSREPDSSVAREEVNSSSCSRAVEQQLSRSLSALSALTPSSSMTTGRSANHVERLINVQPETPRTVPGSSAQAPRHNSRPSGVTTRLQAKKQALNTGKSEATSEGKGKGKARG